MHPDFKCVITPNPKVLRPVTWSVDLLVTTPVIEAFTVNPDGSRTVTDRIFGIPKLSALQKTNPPPSPF